MDSPRWGSYGKGAMKATRTQGNPTPWESGTRPKHLSAGTVPEMLPEGCASSSLSLQPPRTVRQQQWEPRGRLDGAGRTRYRSTLCRHREKQKWLWGNRAHGRGWVQVVNWDCITQASNIVKYSNSAIFCVYKLLLHSALIQWLI